MKNNILTSDTFKISGTQLSEINDAPADSLFLAAIIESSNDAIFSKTLDGTITSWNKSAERIFGFTAEEVIGKNGLLIFPDELVSEEREILNRIAGGEHINHYETVRKRKDGTSLTVSLSVSPIKNAAGEVLGISKIIRDISEDKKTKQNLIRENYFAETLVNSLPGIFYLFDDDGRFMRWNENFERVSGYSGEEIAQVSPLDFFAGDDKKLIQDRIKQVFIAGELTAEADFVAKNGTKTPYFFSGRKVFLDGKQCLIGMGIDISQRNQAEKSLRESENRFRLMADSSPTLIWISGTDKLCTYFNKSWLDFTGRTLEQELGNGWMEGFHPDDFARCLKIYSAAFEARREFEMEFRLRRYDGEFRWILDRGTPFLSPEGDFKGYMGAGLDITEHRRAEESLRKAEERYRVFIENTSEGIWRLELESPIPVSLPVEEQVKFLYENSYIAESNDVKARQYGFVVAEELIGKRLPDLLVRSDAINDDYFRKFIESGYRLLDNETHEKNRNGDDLYFLSNLIGIIEGGNLVRVWGTQRNVTAIKQARQTFLESEEQLRRSQKVEAIGRLAGGIAHDFNNFLAVIMLHVDMLNLQLSPDSPLRYRIEEIKSVTNNAAGMVRQLLAFGRKQTLQPHPVILNHIAREFIKILRPLIGEDIEIKLNLDDDLGVCFVDPDQVAQVLMNLAVNARDAMPKGGVLKISTSNVVLNKAQIRLKSQPTGDYVQLTVSDTGIGMDSETKKRIFEPFFTTKEPNKGTGLGLATVYGIIKQSNGFIWVDTAPGKGTTFEVQFPRIDQPATKIVKEETFKMPTGRETILLVEDEEPVRRAAVEVLNVLGYQVFEAANGEEAIKIARAINKNIHLLLTDLIMPRMNGRELTEAIKSLHAEAKVLFMSGYNDDIISNHGVLDENVNLLNKPFTPLMLANRVRQILDE